MKSKFTVSQLKTLIASLGLVLIAACQPQHEPRIYTAPKQESVFVVQPPKMPGARGLAGSGMGGGMPGMRASSIPMEEKRILGAVFPYLGYGYFLKITDTIARIEGVKASFADVVAKFTVDPQSYAPTSELPDGWTLAPGDGIADAKIEIPAPDGGKPVVMTVTKLNAPAAEAEWKGYLKEQLDRWNGQVGLGGLSIEDWETQLVRVDRPDSSIPAYIFDRDGSHTKSGSIPKSDGQETASGGSPSPGMSAASGGAGASGFKSGAGAPSGAAPPRLQYETPEGWVAQASSPFRMATFRVGAEGSDNEVVVSQALDVPLENCKMWAKQVSKNEEESINQAIASLSNCVHL
ncbi:MAG: hypothetical protein MUC43_04870 [Pirellula sp.]|nr:hypothetical protein [Pirellula sp.]